LYRGYCPARRCGDALAQVGLDEAPAQFEQLFDELRLGARINVGVGHALDDDEPSSSVMALPIDSG
jgi:hypothetical protein